MIFWRILLAWWFLLFPTQQQHPIAEARLLVQGLPSLWDLFSPPPPGANSTTKLVLDALAKAPPGFLPWFRNLPRNVWECIFNCFEQESTDDLNLLQVSDAAYKGFLELSDWAAGGSIEDGFLEDDPQSVTVGGTTFIVAEPCNTISNVAFYRSMFAICDRSNTGLDWSIQREEVQSLVRAFNLVAFGSTYYHASTSLEGRAIDNLAIRILAFTAYQALVNKLPDDPLVINLGNSTRTFTGLQAARELSLILLMDPKSWFDSSKVFDIPVYQLSFAGIVALFFTTTLPTGLDTLAINLIADLLIGKETDRQSFAEIVVPAVKEAVKNVQLPFLDRIKLYPRIAGVFVKVLKAFLWQEKVVSVDFLYEGTFFQSIGAALMPVFNAVGNTLTGYDRSSDPIFQFSFLTYPAGSECNIRNAHSKWHEQIANSFIDLIYLVDDFVRLFSGQHLSRNNFQEESEALLCFVENNCFDGFNISGVDIEVEVQSFQDTVRFLGNCLEVSTEASLAAGLENVGNCILEANLMPNNISLVTEENIEATNSLDACLLANGCLAFKGEFMDVGLLNNCIQRSKTVKEAKCSSFVTEEQAPALAQCFKGCHGGLLCLTGCIHQSGSQVSPLFDIASTCLNTLLLDPEMDSDHAGYQVACLQWARNQALQANKEENFSPRSTRLAERFVWGLPAMATCAAMECQTSYQNSLFHQLLACAITACSASDLVCIRNCFE